MHILNIILATAVCWSSVIAKIWGVSYSNLLLQFLISDAQKILKVQMFELDYVFPNQ